MQPQNEKEERVYGFGLDLTGMMGNEEMADTSNIKLGSGRESQPAWMETLP